MQGMMVCVCVARSLVVGASWLVHRVAEVWGEAAGGVEGSVDGGWTRSLMVKTVLTGSIAKRVAPVALAGAAVQKWATRKSEGFAGWVGSARTLLRRSQADSARACTVLPIDPLFDRSCRLLGTYVLALRPGQVFFAVSFRDGCVLVAWACWGGMAGGLPARRTFRQLGIPPRAAPCP